MRKTPSLRSLMSVLAAVGTFTGFTRAQSLEIFEPAGRSTSGDLATTAVNVSADGTAIIGNTTATGFPSLVPFIWRADTGMFLITNSAGGIRGLIGIDVANGGNRAVLRGQGSDGDSEGLLWTRIHGLQTIGQLTEGPDNHVEPRAISADGTVIVGRAKSINAPSFFLWEAFRWSAQTGMTGLGDIMGDPVRDEFYSEAYGVSHDGRIIAGTVRYGGSEPNGIFGYYAPARWVDGVGPQILAASPYGDKDYGALCMSANGRFIIATSDVGSDEDRINYFLRWSEGVGYTILYEGQRRFTPWDISDDGLVVVGDGNPSGNEEVAMIWTAQRGARPLKNALIEMGINPGAFTFKTAGGVSADGRVIAGYGENINGERRAYRVALWELPPRKIVVNSVADRPALSGASCCDTGEKLPNGDIECTLRAAIEAINAGCDNRITFAVPDVAIPRITPQIPLPAINVKVEIDGTTQSGGKVEISGTDSTGICLDLQGGGSTVRGLVINTFTGAKGIAIRLFGGAQNSIVGNYLGTDVSGNVGAFNVQNIVVTNSSNNAIGTTKPGEGNVIGDWVTILGDASANNSIVANRIGVGADGTSEIGRTIGVAVVGASGTTIGGTSGAGNHLAGLSEIAVLVSGGRDTVVEGNFVGLDVPGVRSLGGEIGIVGASGTASSVSNLTIRSNKVAGVRAGIAIVGSKVTGAQVTDNSVGLRFDGSGTLPAGVDANYAKFGIRVDGSPNVQVLRNVVAGADLNLLVAGKPQLEYIPCEDTDGDGLCNTPSQIRFYSPENPKIDDEAHPQVGGVIVAANTIGLNDTVALPTGVKQRFGVTVYRGVKDLQIRNNVVAGHSESDVWLRDGVRLQLMQNRIGSPDGSPRNSQMGVIVDETSDVTIAPAGTFVGNTISFQKKVGVLVRGGATNLLVRGNQIGTGPGGAVAWPNGIGIKAAGPNITDLRIENNLIDGSVTNGVFLELPGNKAILQGNRIGVSSAGLALSNKVGVVIEDTAVDLRDNTIAHNGTGVVIRGTHPALIQGGPLYQNGDGAPEAAIHYLDQTRPAPVVFVIPQLVSPAGKVVRGFAGVATSDSAADVEIELYGNRAGERQGRTPLGRKTVRPNDKFEIVLEGEPGSALDTLPEFSATATQSGRTSTLSLVKPLRVEARPVVTSTSATDITLQWPATIPFTLERSSTPSGPWIPVVTVPVVVDDTASVTLPLGGDAQFFRLVLGE